MISIKRRVVSGPVHQFRPRPVTVPHGPLGTGQETLVCPPGKFLSTLSCLSHVAGWACLHRSAAVTAGRAARELSSAPVGPEPASAVGTELTLLTVFLFTVFTQ